MWPLICPVLPCPPALVFTKRAEGVAARSQDRRTRLATILAGARLRAALGGRSAERGVIQGVLREADSAGFRELGYRARLVLGEMAMGAGDATGQGRAGLLRLERDARGQGLLFLAREAAQARRLQ